MIIQPHISGTWTNSFLCLLKDMAEKLAKGAGKGAVKYYRLTDCHRFLEVPTDISVATGN
jgi:hypothetical protein